MLGYIYQKEEQILVRRFKAIRNEQEIWIPVRPMTVLMGGQGSFEYQAHSVNYPGYTRMSAFEEAGFRLRPCYLYAGLYPRAAVTLGRRW